MYRPGCYDLIRIFGPRLLGQLPLLQVKESDEKDERKMVKLSGKWIWKPKAGEMLEGRVFVERNQTSALEKRF